MASQDLDSAAGGRENLNEMASEHARVWEEGRFLLFVSHAHSYQGQAAEFRDGLARFAISGFVAHQDIQPTQPWEEVIRQALMDCDALAVLLSTDATSSDWVDQETGWALGRDALVIPVHVGINPYGFIARYQALPSAGKTWHEVANQVYWILLGVDPLRWTPEHGEDTFPGRESTWEDTGTRPSSGLKP